MTARITTYDPTPTSVEHNRFCLAEGTDDEIKRSAPPGMALGFPNDSQAIWRFTTSSGWLPITTPPSSIVYVDNSPTFAQLAQYGTAANPFHTADTALAALVGAVSPVAIHLAPSATSYTHTGNITWPAVDIVIFGNHCVFQVVGNITIQGSYASHELYIDQTGYTTTFSGPSTATYMPMGGAHIGNLVVTAGSLQRVRHAVTGTITTSGTGTVIECEPNAAGTALVSTLPVTAPNVSPRINFGSRWVFDGDSITAGFGGVQTMAAILNGRMVIAGNVGVPGQNLGQMYARIAATLALNPSGIWLMGGTNDAGVTSLAAYTATMISYITTVKNAGIQLILTLVPPKNSNTLAVQQINTVIRRIASTYGVPLCDPWETYRANDGTWVSGASSDGIHPVGPIMQVCAASANAQLAGYLTSIPLIFPPLAQPDGGLRANNLFLTDTNADGLADGINAATDATNTLITAALPALGKIQRMVWSASANGGSALVFGAATTPGDRILAVGRIAFDPGAGANTKIEVKFVGDYGGKTHGFLFGGAGILITAPLSGIFALELTAIAASTSFDANPGTSRFTAGTVAGTLDLSQMQFYNLTAMGLA